MMKGVKSDHVLPLLKSKQTKKSLKAETMAITSSAQQTVEVQCPFNLIIVGTFCLPNRRSPALPAAPHWLGSLYIDLTGSRTSFSFRCQRGLHTALPA